MAKSAIATRSIKTFNNLAGRAAAKGSECLSLMWKAGETALQAKESIPHGEWVAFVEKHYDVDIRSVQRWIKFHESVPESKCDTVSSLTAGLKMLEEPKDTSRKGAAPAGVTDDQEPGSEDDSGEEGATSDGTGEPQQEETPQPPEEGTDEQGEDLGNCPNCGGNEWLEDEFGVSCTSCHHPHGEPVGDKDDPTAKQIATEKAKTRKTAEALQRAFGDLNDLEPSPKYDSAIKLATAAVEVAKSWP